MRISLLFIVLFSIAAQVKAQDKPSFGVKAGLNLSILSASVNSESSFKTGLNAGVFCRTKMRGKLYFRPEVIFSSQGQKDNYQDSPGGPSVGKTTTTINYLNIPLLLEAGEKVSVQFGVQTGILLSSKEEGERGGVKVNEDLDGVMLNPDISLVFGIGFRPIEHVDIGARMNYGITKIFDDSDLSGFPAIKNRVFQFYVGYAF
jgi:Outer membrane protein beta-barrel domain